MVSSVTTDTSKPVPDHERLSLRRPGFPRSLSAGALPHGLSVALGRASGLRIGLLLCNGDVSRIQWFEAPLWNWSMLHCDCGWQSGAIRNSLRCCCAP
jgi:hypothetical protein